LNVRKGVWLVESPDPTVPKSLLLGLAKFGVTREK